MGVACLAHACSVPVFRYALDHWTPDQYRIRIVHDGALTAEQGDTVQQLRDQAQASFANLVVDDVDLTAADDTALADLYRQSESNGQPLCIVQTPTAVPETYRDVWSGPLSSELPDTLLASPVREQLIKSLLAGTSVVWIYLDSGIKPIDDANYQLLQTELERLQGVLKLPEIDPVDLKELSTSPEDLKLKFTALRLSRENPDEALLVEMLLSTEPDLRDETYLSQPMAFPVFGRGRVLYSLVGEGITAELIEEACRFLTGACQCTVKAQNPGAELLLSVDWDGLISPSAPTEVDVTLTGLAGFRSDAPPVLETDADQAVTTTALPPVEPPIEDVASTAEEVLAVAPEVDTETASTQVAETDDVESTPPTITRRPAEDETATTRPVVVVAVLGLLVVIGSFFLLPKR